MMPLCGSARGAPPLQVLSDRRCNSRGSSMLDRLWRCLFRPAVMRDADRLIAAHGRGAYGMARLGATAAREVDGHGHWCSVAREIARRLERDRRAA